MDPTVNPESIVNQLNRILGSDQFAVAFRIKKLLKFLVDAVIKKLRYHKIFIR